MKKITASILAAWLFAAPAAANDSTAETRAGGLVLTRTDAIDMASEDLFVSADEVRVRYVFRNRTAKDVRTTVAFPMPDDDLANREYGDVAFPHDFVTRVDGKPVRMAIERKAVLGNKDHTALLAALRVPLSEDASARLDRLGKADQERLLALGLATSDDQGAGVERHLAPAWTVKETYHWEQVFPAGRDLVVEHRYVPGTGGSVGTALAIPKFRRDAEGRAYIARYCADAAFLAGVDRLARAAGDASAALPERRIAYVLKTGANWRAPIGSFRLVIDKGAPENLVSFCADGVRKISPTQFEVRRKDWRPDRDLDVLIVVPRSAP
ncbi:MAG: DUF4424 domain-containing protein [Sphingomonas sp.]|uniref:DUF4424 domain-containing protein n=1 Tax=Sphingomonas sp. TaxID=28214 RepID=UPI002272361F|nr:DUF4424 domain-containing protein [Sphingomonas sp.]MCX8475561.1 DUF4424 domain-containing protein [Sphingomonas sp.]